MKKRIHHTLLCFLLILTGCSGQSEKQSPITELKDDPTYSAGVLTGSTHEIALRTQYPNIKLKHFDSETDLFTAIEHEKTDIMIAPEATIRLHMNGQNKYRVIGELMSESLGFGFNKKDKKLLEQFNRFLAEIKAQGVIVEIENRWFDDTGDAKIPDLGPAPQGNPIIVATSGTMNGFNFFRHGKLAGIDIEIMERFGRYMGRPIEFLCMNFGGLISVIASGKADIVASSMMITEERAEQINFSEPYFSERVIAVVKRVSPNEETVLSAEDNFFTKCKKSFYNNFIVEKRYMLVLEGLKQTLIITIFATILGTILGGIVCMMRMSKRKILSFFAVAYINIMRRTPLLVLLMILFYIVFSSSALNATTVSIIAFALNMAAYCSEMFRSAIEGIDRGQKEAGIALGLSSIQTFIYIQLPQLVKRVLPVYKGETISLLKMTSIVGYIAVVDLTKASDIVRSRTFDAFFPLIVVAVIYFFLAWMIEIGIDYLYKKQLAK